MDYKKKLIEMLEKADHDQTYTIFRFVCSFLGKIVQSQRGWQLLPFP